MLQAAARAREAIGSVEPVRRETVMETVVRRIESLLATGQLKVGDRLPPEPELARMLHVSRSSLREALKGLVFLGLIKSSPGRGTHIQAQLTRIMSRHFQWMVLLDQVKYLEIYELRAIIEPAAAALAAQRATAGDLDRMEKTLAGLRLAVDSPQDFHRFDIEFHDALAQAAGNAALQTTMLMLYQSMSEARLRVLPMIDNMLRHYKRHERVYRYIRDRRPELARRAVLEDLRYAQQLLRQQVKAENAARVKETSGRPIAARKGRAAVGSGD